MTTRDGSQVLSGGDGNDTLAGGADGDSLDGGAGDADWLDYGNSGAGVTVDLQAKTAASDPFGHAHNDTIDGFEAVGGGSGANVLLGDGNDNTLAGGEFSGNNRLTGRGGDDSLIGHDGADTLDGGADDDTLRGGAGGDTYILGGGADQVIGTLAELDGDTIDGFGADDKIIVTDGTHLISATVDGNVTTVVVDDGTYDDSGEDSNAVTIVLNGVTDTLQMVNGEIRVAAPSNGPDDLMGSEGNDTIDALDGDDTVSGLSGDDVLSGGDGDDFLVGSDGADTLSGGDGDDSLSGGAHGDRLIGGAGSDVASYVTRTPP